MDAPVRIGHGQTMSQPFIVALMTHLAALKFDDTVLEVGTGSGYQAAVLARLARKVCSVEIVPPLAEAAARVLRELGYDNVSVKVGDGYLGWPECGPFDAMIVTAALDHVPPPLIEQLKVGGQLIERLLVSGGARIINTASAAHQRATLDFDDLQSANGFRATKAYSRSKLCNILFTRELALRVHDTGVTANCLHPGFVATRFADESGGLISRFAWLAKFFAYPPLKALKRSSISHPRRRWPI
jgi:protein-L-isoaspartate O-methyltransferase